jgi:hypothetical protein
MHMTNTGNDFAADLFAFGAQMARDTFTPLTADDLSRISHEAARLAREASAAADRAHERRDPSRHLDDMAHAWGALSNAAANVLRTMGGPSNA